MTYLKSKFEKGIPLLMVDKNNEKVGISIFKINLDTHTYQLGTAEHEFQAWQWFYKYSFRFDLCIYKDIEDSENVLIPIVEIDNEYIDFSKHLEKIKLGYLPESKQFKDYVAQVPYFKKTFEMFNLGKKQEIRFKPEGISIDHSFIECCTCRQTSDINLIYSMKDISYHLICDLSKAILLLIAIDGSKNEKYKLEDIKDTWVQLYFTSTATKNEKEYISFFSEKSFFKKQAKCIKIQDNFSIIFKNIQLDEKLLNLDGVEIPYCDWKYVSEQIAFYFLIPMGYSIIYKEDYFQIGERDKWYTEESKLFIQKMQFLNKNLPFLNGEIMKMQCIESSEIANWQINQNEVYKNGILIGVYQWVSFTYAKDTFTSILKMKVEEDNNLVILQSLAGLVIKIDFLGTWKRIMN